METDALEAALELLSFGLVAVTARALQEVTHAEQLTFLQWRILVVLGFATDGLRVADLASRIGASRPSTSRLVRRLGARDWVVASVDPVDRRAVRLRLTDAGAALRAKVVSQRNAIIRETINERHAEPAVASAVAGIATDCGRWV
jgi:DNA-binding MarR family transcriptional regulator